MKEASDRQNKPSPALPAFAQKLRKLLRPHRRRHDPLLVLTLATFNAGGGLG